jgi:hypothetical protein
MEVPMRSLLVPIAVLALACAVAAQTPPPIPKPTAEHQKLAYFVGNWTSAGEMKPSPFGPGGKMTGTETCEWFAGNYSVVCRASGTSPMGPMKSLGILGYAAEEKAYTFYGTDSMGMNTGTVAKGSMQGDTWTFTDESVMMGQKVKSRWVMKISSPTSYTFRWEMDPGGGKWATVVEGTATKKK